MRPGAGCSQRNTSTSFRTVRSPPPFDIIFFQIKGLSEWMVTRADWWLWRKMIRYDPEFEQWKAQLWRPGRLTAAINIYRANLKLRYRRIGLR